MLAYSAYNLCIHSEIPLPELILSDDNIVGRSPDVIIHLRKLSPREHSAIDGGNSFLGDSFLGELKVGKFFVQNGRQIVIEPVPGIEEAVIRSVILGPSLSVLLRQRRFLVLHASCVRLENTAVAFLGHSRWGKSTLAEAFHTKGYNILTDDLMAVKMDVEQPIVFPGFPQIKLWSDAATSVGHTPKNLPLQHSMTEKLVHRFTEGFCQKPLPLKRLYVLDKGTQHSIEPLHPVNAFLDLVRYSHAVNLLQTPDFTKAHFEQCQRLVKQVSVCRLQRRFSLDALPDLVKLIEEDIKEAVCTI